ncbi:MAG: Glu-tRNA(Gln) amidotransferase subunit GatD [Candidatus Thorarchaeota archaeon]
MSKNGIEIWSRISIKTSKGTFKGIVIPRGEQGDENHLILKLSNGYNIGINIQDIEEIKIIEQLNIEYKIPDKSYKKNPNKPTVTLLGTGGTVASKLDYVTGAVLPAFTSQELFNAIPELQDICNLETKQLFQILSENIKPDNWITIANEIANQIETINPTGIVVAHGTDTLHYTSAALSFMLKNINFPIIFVGSQRSSDRPSSDAAINLISSVQAATLSDIAEVVVCMHGQTGDSYNLLHRGTRVRKMHTSRRDAFKTIGDSPLAKIKNGKIIPTGINYNKRKAKQANLETDILMDKKVGLLYFYPGLNSEIIDYYIDKQYSGLVFAGTGLGHISQDLLPSVKRAKEENIPLFMTSQCLWGFTGMNVYETGRLLLREGVIPLANMLPETALVKAMWVLGHTKEIPFVKELMQRNLAGEITQSERFEDYLVLQGKLDKGLMKLLEKE